MDRDPHVENELDSFSLFLPLPFRVGIIIVLGVWAWGLNLQWLYAVKIDVPALIRYPSRPSPAHPSHHESTYRLATLLTVPLLTVLLFFWAVTRGDPSSVLDWHWLPNVYLLFLALGFIVPVRQVSFIGRYRFLTSLRRVSIGGLASAAEGKFGDILLADVLTSYAKIFGDLFVVLCMIFAQQYSTQMPDRNCGGVFVVPFLIAVPSLIRLRQCLIEYKRVRRGLEDGSLDRATAGWGGQHLANAAKYSSAFPVVLFSALQRGYEQVHLTISEASLYKLWVTSVLANSLYSFYWDVSKDWDLPLFSATLHTLKSRLVRRTSSSSSSNPSTPSPTRLRFLHSIATSISDPYDPSQPYGLRRHRYFHSANVYYVAIALDLLLRMTWSLKLSPHLDHFNDLEGGVFAIQSLEVFRRWIWIFLRVETEWVRSNRGPAPDDVLLGEFHD